MSAPPGGSRRDLALLPAGQAVSVTGDAAALVALLLRLRPDGSGWVAALLGAELVPFVICGPFSGRLVDRVETRRVLLFALAGQAIVAIPLALLTSPLATVLIFALLNALSTLVRPATSALVPVITGPAGAARGYARVATGAGLGFTIGPVFGGLITGSLGTTSALLMDAGSFAVLTVAVAFVRARRPPARAGARDGRHKDAFAGGFALLWREPVLRTALVITAVATGCAVVDNVAAPFRFINQLGTSDLGYGGYLAVWGLASLAGVPVLPRISEHYQPAALAIGNALTGLGIAGIGLAPSYPVALVAAAVGGFGNGLVNVADSALIARHTPQAQHGRAFAAAGAVVQAAIGVGTAAAAPLVGEFGAGTAMTIAGGLAAASAAGGLVVLGRRKLAPRVAR